MEIWWCNGQLKLVSCSSLVGDNFQSKNILKLKKLQDEQNNELKAYRWI